MLETVDNLQLKGDPDFRSTSVPGFCSVRVHNHAVGLVPDVNVLR